MHKTLVLVLLFGLVLGTGSPVQADEVVVTDEVITLQQGQVWSPECGIVQSGQCGDYWGTNFGEFLGEAVIGFGLVQGGVFASTLGFGGQERWDMDALTIVATAQSSVSLSHLLVGWVVYGTDLHGRPWKAQVIYIDGDQIRLRVVVYSSVIGVTNPEYTEVDGLARWSWLVEIPEANFWSRVGIGGEVSIEEFSWGWDFRPAAVIGELPASQMQNHPGDVFWKICVQGVPVFIGTTKGPLRWPHQIFLPNLIK